jgi:uncharacterized protein (DUF1501 family)
MTTRRHLLHAALAGATLMPWARLAVAAAPAAGPRRFVFVILRGGMDGLTAVPATGDPAFAEARGTLGHFTPFGAEPLKLDATFALHPLLPQLHAMYGRQELAVLHAVGLPYKERSHFDAQQVLESGGLRPYELATGWLGRAIGGTGLRAVALETAVPLVLRGPGPVRGQGRRGTGRRGWTPGRLRACPSLRPTWWRGWRRCTAATLPSHRPWPAPAVCAKNPAWLPT